MKKSVINILLYIIILKYNIEYIEIVQSYILENKLNIINLVDSYEKQKKAEDLEWLLEYNDLVNIKYTETFCKLVLVSAMVLIWFLSK